MKNKNIFAVLMIAVIIFYSGGKPVLAVSVDEIRTEIKCPDHDRPEVLALVEGLVNEGKTKDEILDAVAEKFGEEIFAVTREKKMGSKPFIIPAFSLAVAFIFGFVYIKKWITKGEKTTLLEKEIVEASKDITDYNKKFIEEYELFKKED
jgi:hypothetical protein